MSRANATGQSNGLVPCDTMSIMRSLPRLACGLLLSVVIALLVARVTATEQARSEGPRIDVLFSREARAETVTGMVYVAISRDNRRSPIDQTSPTGVPLFSRLKIYSSVSTGALHGSERISAKQVARHTRVLLGAAARAMRI